MRRSTALTFEMIKTSNRYTALKRIGLGGALGAGALFLPGALGAGALGMSILADRDSRADGLPSDARALNATLDSVYSGSPDTQRLFRQPIQLNSADPFTSINNVRQRAVDAKSYADQTIEDQPSTGFFDTAMNRLVDVGIQGQYALGNGYLNSDTTGIQRRNRMPLASF
jgi:hypothetical protein